MKLDELHGFKTTLTDNENQLVDANIDEILDYFTVTNDTPLLEDEDGGGGGEENAVSPGPSETPNSVQHGGFGGGLWLNTFVKQMRWLAASNNIKKRLKELGISGDALTRIDAQIKMATRHIEFLINNPMQYSTKQFVFVDSNKANKVFKDTIKQHLIKLPKHIFIPGAQ